MKRFNVLAALVLFSIPFAGSSAHGGNADGHAPKVNLSNAAEVTGSLPIGNVNGLSTALSLLASTAALSSIASNLASEISRAGGQENKVLVTSACAGPKIQATYSHNRPGRYDEAGNSPTQWVIPLSEIDGSLTIDNTLILLAKITFDGGTHWFIIPSPGYAVAPENAEIYMFLQETKLYIRIGSHYGNWVASIQLLVRKMDDA